MKLIILAALLAISSHAGVFTLTGVDGSRGANVTVNENGTPFAGFAGVLNGTYDGVSVGPLFCVDLFTDINYGSYNAIPTGPDVNRQEDRAAWLYLNRLSTVNSTDSGLALQLAIWDIVHDNGDGFSTGLVLWGPSSITGLTQAQIDIANGYLADSFGQSANTGISIYHNFDQTTGAPVQTLMGAAAPVPETRTMLLTAAGVYTILAKVKEKRPACS